MKNILFIAVICLSFLGLNNSALAVSLSLSPASTSAVTGDIVTLDLVISGLGNHAPASLGAFDVDITYDAAVLALNAYAYGNFLGDILLGEALEAGGGDLGGIIDLAEISLLDADPTSGPAGFGPFLDDIQPDSFILATLEFSVVALAPSTNTIVTIDTNYVLGDGYGNPLTVDSLTDAVIYNRSTIVPEPTTFVLFGLGIIGLVKGKKRRRN